MQVDKRDKVELLRKLAYVEDFRGLAFFNSLSDLGSAEEKLQYRGVEAVSLASDVNVKYRKVFWNASKTISWPSCWPPIWSLVESILNILSVWLTTISPVM